MVADPVLVMWSDRRPAPGARTATSPGSAAAPPYEVGERLRHFTGRIVLDTDVYSRLQRSRQQLDQRLILEHEIGHVLGLDHVARPAPADVRRARATVDADWAAVTSLASRRSTRSPAASPARTAADRASGTIDA